MGEDNLTKLSEIVALVSLCLNLKGHGRGIKIRAATHWASLADFVQKPQKYRFWLILIRMIFNASFISIED